MNSPYSFSRWRMSLTLSSRRVSVFWVIQAVATVADPPTSEPSTAAIALTIALSMRSLIHAGGHFPSKSAKRLPQLLDDMRLDLRGLQLPYSLDRLLAIRKIEHQHVVQLCESDGIGCSAHRSVFLEHTLDDAGIEDSYLTKQRTTCQSRGRARRCSSPTRRSADDLVAQSWIRSIA